MKRNVTPDYKEERSVINADNIILITGATGRQGGAVIRHMLPKGWKLRALTRNAASAPPAASSKPRRVIMRVPPRVKT